MPRRQGAGPNAIKAVFFDIGNVLVRFDSQGLVRSFSGLLRRHPLRFAQVLLSSSLTDRMERGDLKADELYRALQEELGFTGNFTTFRRLWCGYFSLEPKSAALLRRVARRYRVYLLSNTNRLHYNHIRDRYAFARQVHGAVLSYRVGMRKPEPGIYRTALRRARVAASEAFFVDDLPENVDAAARLGIQAWRYTGPEELELQLFSLGLL